MNASIPQPRRSLSVWLSTVVWLSAFLSPTAYLLLLLFASKFQINVPETFAWSLLFLIPLLVLYPRLARHHSARLVCFAVSRSRPLQYYSIAVARDATMRKIEMPNKPAAPNPAITSRLQALRHWRGVDEPERSML